MSGKASFGFRDVDAADKASLVRGACSTAWRAATT